VKARTVPLKGAKWQGQYDLSLMHDQRPKTQKLLAFAEESRSEAPIACVEGSESCAAKQPSERLAEYERLM
jgi:hypothetical protein